MENASTEGRLAVLETRLTAIERRLGLTPAVASPASSAPLSVAARDAELDPFGDDDEMPGARSAAVVAEENPGNWLGIIAIICFVAAAGFIVKLSIDSGWLTPVRQIGMAALLGFGLIGAGLGLMGKDRAYASLLPGGGIIVLYLTAFAAHRLYGLIPFEAAMIVTGLISALCVGLYGHIRHDVYPITATLGAYVAPALLGIDTQAVFSLYYFLVCSVAFAIISIAVRSRALVLISAYLAIAVTGLVGLHLGQDGMIAAALAGHFLLFSLSTFFYTQRNGTTLSDSEAWCFLPVLLIFYALEYYFIDRLHPGLAPWLSLGFCGVLGGLYLAARRFFDAGRGSQTLVLAFAAIAGFHSVYLELLPDDVRPWLFALLLVAGACVPVGIVRKANAAHVMPGVALFAIIVIEYLTMAEHLWRGYSPAWLAVSFASVASLWAVHVCRAAWLAEKGFGHVVLGAAHVLAILGLYRLTTDMGSLAVSASWLFYAVGVMLFAFARKDRDMAQSALFVLGFAAGKALLYDAASAATVIRILCLLLTGAVLYGCGFFMRRIAGWKDDASPN